MAQIHDNINEEKYKDKIKTEKCFLYQFLKIIYSTLLKILFRPQIIGKENIPQKGALIFAGNQISPPNCSMMLRQMDNPNPVP